MGRLARLQRVLGRFTQRTVKIADRYFRLPPKGVGISEPWMTDLLRNLLPARRGTFLDVGVNVGQTLLKVKALDPDRPYVGFEPNPTCVDYTERLIAVNSIQQCRIIPAGLSQQTSVVTLDLFTDDPADSSASIISEFRAQNPIHARKTVVVLALSDVPEEMFLEPVAIVKIDVEGAELDVLQTLSSIIQRDRPVVLIEILPCYSVEQLERIRRQDAIQSMFRTWNYELYRVEKARDRLHALERVDDIGIHSELKRCEYLAAGREMPLNFLPVRSTT